MLGRQMAEELVLSGEPPRGRSDGSDAVGLRALELVDEPLGLVAGELAGSLPLCEPEWSPRVPEAGVAGVFEEAEQLLHLSG